MVVIVALVPAVSGRAGRLGTNSQPATAPVKITPASAIDSAARSPFTESAAAAERESIDAFMHASMVSRQPDLR
jgi:hypothetical protein